MEKGLMLQGRRKLIQGRRHAYQGAKRATKGIILDEVCQLTGYHRMYARWLLTHPEPSSSGAKRGRPCQYGPEVQHILLLAWHAANRICTRRLMPYLPTWLDVLERHEQVQIPPESRAQLLTMSVATADRLLHAQRMRGVHGLRGLSTTKAGTLLRQQIPIRTWAHWNDTQPGFLEGDLVAHSGSGLEGAFLFTLTLTDVATGWTECVPVYAKGEEVVLHAFQRARTLFPFPILGLDVDCGSEFLNDLMVDYCTQEQIMLTRGRPAMKNDQCHVEARNRYQVREVVGHDRYSGEYAYRQLTEVYRALRLYVNCFQPSMKLMSKEEDGSPVRRRYDPAKTPLQRLLLSGVLSPAREQELTVVAQALDPVRLLSQLQALQHALFRCAANASPFSHHQPVTPIQVFAWERCVDGSLPPALHPASATSSTGENDLPIERLLVWRRTRTNPFEGEWAFIASSLLTHPDLTTPELFQQLQQRSPGRYHAGHLRSLQRGVRHIRTQLLLTRDDPWNAELIHGIRPAQVIPLSGEEAATHSPQDRSAVSLPQDLPVAAPSAAHRGARTDKATRARRTGRTPSLSPDQAGASLAVEEAKALQESSLGQAIHAYLQQKIDANQSPATVLWHRTSLRSFQQYLHAHQWPQEPGALTETIVQEWLTHVQTTPGATGALRATNTVITYARSLRAFGNWLVGKGLRSLPLLTSQTLPPASPKPLHLVEPETFSRLLTACRPLAQEGFRVDCAMARNQALLWLMWEGGLPVSEICALRVGDVFEQTGIVHIAGTGAKMRRIALGPEGQRALQTYLKLAHGAAPQRNHEETLFTGETGQPLTRNALTLLFVRLNQRTGITGTQISPTMLRDTFAVRYLQTGGHAGALQEMLGLRDLTAVRRYQRVAGQGKERQE